MNTDGTKSRKECTTEADIMQQHTATDAPYAPAAGSSTDSMAGYAASRTDAKVLTWIPGTIPLKAPMQEPANERATHIRMSPGSTERVSSGAL